MFNYGSIKYLFAKVFIGLILIIISSFLLFNLIIYNYGNTFSNIIKISPSLFSYNGILISKISFVLIGYSSYLIPLFFFILGTKLTLGIKTKHFLLKFFLLIISVLLLNLFTHLLNYDGGLFGKILYNLIHHYLKDQLEINIFFWLFISIIFLSFITSTYFALGLSFKNKLKRILLFLGLFISGFKVLKFFLNIFTPKKNKKNLKYKKNINKKFEPTIQKIKKNNIFTNTFTSPNNTKKENGKYVLPSPELLDSYNQKLTPSREAEKRNVEFSKKLEIILKEYGVEGKIVNFKSGPVVTLYEFLPAPGVKTSKVVGLSDDITRAMSSLSTRISSQPGKTSIGIEIPNPKRENVMLGDLIKDEKFSLNKSGLTLALGKNIAGEKKFTDLEKMPHLLIAGTTGSGKSVGINSMIISLLYRFTPSECKLILIDPKMLELSIYEDIPHLLTPVVTNPNKAVFALKWVVREMEDRYRLMSSLNVKNIDSFNSKILKNLATGRKLYREVQTGIDRNTRKPIIEKKEISLEKMPLIVVVIDEMADLMMVAGKEVESLVQRLAQMARASGIHLIAATQRPSVDVITGTIKANFPSRISFRVASRFDSRTILNEMGAEQLLGSGDMLFLENGANITRLHGGFVSEKEIENVVNHIKSQSSFNTQKDITLEENKSNNTLELGFSNRDVDELYDKAISIVIEQQKVSTSFIQRYLQIGYNRAARIVEKMEEDGYISEPSHAGKRNVLKKNK